MAKARILIGSASFDERSNYQEVVFAKALTRLGYDVLVVSAIVKSGPGETGPRGYRIAKVEKYIRIRDTFFACRGLDRIVADFKPDAAFLLAPNHGLPYALLEHLPAACKVVPYFGDLRESHVIKGGKWLSRRGNPVIKRFLKDRWYRALLHRADLIVPCTNETQRILEEVDAESLRGKVLMRSLAVDPSDFFYDPSLRSPNDGLRTIITVTRIDPLKPVKEWTAPVLAWLRQNPGWRYVLGGLPPGTEGARLKAELEAPDLGDRFRLLGRLTAEEINRLYNNADLAIWFLAAIGIQQSMITGLPVLLPAHNALDHLVNPGVNGLYYSSSGDIPSRLSEAAAISWDRAAVAKRNEGLSANVLLKSVLDRIGIP
ncbi:MAG TPA: glycosyltransferase [Verrucomicrobiales bacterium]|nr:glycosyltransferase [Verrucomicrobiales bacterium]